MASRKKKRRKGRSKMGPAPFKPTQEQRRQVETLAGLGTRYQDICLMVRNPATDKPIARATLFKHFRIELDQGVVKANARVAESLFKKATGKGAGSVAAAIFWLKVRCGWREKNEVEITGNTGVLVVPAAVTPEEWVDRQRRKNETRENPMEAE